MPITRIYLQHAGQTIAGSISVDSLSQIILFPEPIAKTLGIDLTNAPQQSITGVGGSRVLVRYAQLTLELRPVGHACRWQTWVGFAATQRWLFGNFGGLEHFHFTLDPWNEEFMLDPRDSLPRV
jgi:hypothetical protein